ncbi:MAG: threonine aldolase family protein [Acidobacteriota bacterium]
MSAAASIDLRSDTVTQPTPAMRQAMAEAEVGDDVYGEDPTVRALEEECAELLGHEAALFMPSGCMGNQVAIHLHTRAGDEVIVEASGHSYDYELSGMAALSGVQPRAVIGDRGLLRVEDLRPHLAERPYYRSAVGLVIVENTHNMAGGRLVPEEDLRAVLQLCTDSRVPVHLDGARLFNAAVASGDSPAALAFGFDTVMVSLSKGLCAPAGSLLVGGSEPMREARRVRKLFGGGMRQVGVLAAAGRVALATMIDRLAEDHANARRLAAGLLQCSTLELAFGHVDTNIVVVDIAKTGLSAAAFCTGMRQRGVLCLATGPTTVRFVTHHDINDTDIDVAVKSAGSLLAG